MNSYRLLLSVICASVLLASCSNYTKVLKSKDIDYKLAMADKYFSQKKYRIAQELYEELYPVYKGTEKFEEIYYKDAYCFYHMKDYRNAENFFKGFLEVFPNSTRAEEVDFMHAYCFYLQSPKIELDQTYTSKSIGVMQTFINTHPGSDRIKDANVIIDKCREKLEVKDYRAAELYFKIGQYRAAALAFEALLNSYPESAMADVYKYKIVKSYYRYAKLSVLDKQVERYERVVDECNDFIDRFPESKHLSDAQSYKNLSLNSIKEIKNEQIKTSAKR